MFDPVSLTRQYDLIPMDKLGMPITIIGAGAVGGWTALALLKMGFGNLTIIDFDKVELENVNCQLYGPDHVGMLKVNAFQLLASKMTALIPQVRAERYTNQEYQGIVISAVDSMEVRRAIWQAHAAANPGRERYVIDPRMGAETALLYVMRSGLVRDLESYAKTLYTDQNAMHEPCTRKATAYCALPLSGLVAAQVKAIVTGQSYARITQWDIPKGGFQTWLSNA